VSSNHRLDCGPAKIASRCPKKKARRRRYQPGLEVLEDRTLLTVFWNVDADGFWDEASNWIDDQGTSRAPVANDDVVIDRPAGNFSVTHRTPNNSVRSIVSRERLILANPAGGGTGTLTVTGTVEATEGLTLNRGILANATVAANTTIFSEAGQLSGVTVNGTIDLSAVGGFFARSLTVSNGLTLNGTMRIGSISGSRTGSARFGDTQTLAGTGTVILERGTLGETGTGGVMFTIGAGLTIQATGGTIGANGTLFNNATITASGNGNVLELVSIDNRGSIRAENGATVNIRGIFANRSTLNVLDSTLEMWDNFNNTGTIQVDNTTTRFRGTFTPVNLGSFRR
jgi:hypothetical protein